MSATHDGVRSIQRALDLLDLFDEHHPTRSAARPGRRLGTAQDDRRPRAGDPRGARPARSRGRDDLLVRPGAAPVGAARRDPVGGLPRSAREDARAGRAVRRDRQPVRAPGCRPRLHRAGARTATVRSVVAVGEPMPLGRGATAKVLLSGAPADLIEVLRAATPTSSRRRWRARSPPSARPATPSPTASARLGSSAVAAPVTATTAGCSGHCRSADPPHASPPTRCRATSRPSSPRRRARPLGLGSVAALL